MRGTTHPWLENRRNDDPLRKITRNAHAFRRNL